MFSPDGTKLASGSYNPPAMLWDTSNWKEIYTFSGNSYDVVYCVAFSPDGKMLALGQLHIIELWCVETGKQICTLIGHSDEVSSVSFSKDGKILASGSKDCTMKLWDVATKKEIYSFFHLSSVMAVDFSHNGKILASGSTDKSIKLWNVKNFSLIASLISFDKEDWAVITPDNFFDCSSGAWQHLHFVQGLQMYPLDMASKFYCPGLLAKRLEKVQSD